ncbi:hypothetical protein [Lysinibacillus xylanilyticus]|uniref:hypothetical protein n=1 Tax=Lysinibacillus xylanilyticus TaxID=582475 RepID=UPI003D041BB1
MFSVAKAKRQLQCFNCAKAKRQQQMFSVAKAKRQLQCFNCAKVKRQLQNAQPERKINLEILIRKKVNSSYTVGYCFFNKGYCVRII